MAYRVDRPEAHSDNYRLERWANNTTEQLMFALNDLDIRLKQSEEKQKALTEIIERLNIPTNDLYDLKSEIESLGSSVDINTDNISTLSDNYTALELRVQALEQEGE